MESIMARALESTLKYWLKSFSRDEGRTVQLSNIGAHLIYRFSSEDPYYVQSIGPPFPYSCSLSSIKYINLIKSHIIPFAYSLFSLLPQHLTMYQTMDQMVLEDMSNSVTLGVAEEHIGIVVGRSGRNITEISQISGARIKISERGDFIYGTSDRKVAITGSQRAINVAKAMIMHKVASASSPPPVVTTEK
ncbi:hypothetical protein LXL04_034607 [Taraxacum kok-saghyz]